MEVYVNPSDIDMILELYGDIEKTFVIKSFPKNEVRRRCCFFVEGKDCIIDFFIRKDRKVKIIPTGKNVEYANKVIDFIRTKTMDATINSETCVIDCEETVINDLVEYMQSNCSNLVDVVRENNIIRFIGYHGDVVTCTFYKTTSKLMIQTKPLQTFSLIITYLSEREDIEIDKIINITNVVTNQSITKEVIRNEMKHILVNSYEYLDEALKKSIAGSLVLLKRKDFSEDYTGYVTGEFKALEGYLKKILTQKYNYMFERGKENFIMFKKDFNGNNIIDMDNNITDEEKKSLNLLYNIYKNKRNIYLHSKIDPSQTRIIENISEAQSLSDEILNAIENTYNIIFK